MKPYQQIPIFDCGEPLVPIPLKQFAVETPHPYVAVGASYGNKSPYYLREGVLARLIQAQRSLQSQYPGWQIQIFDAYRPITVQQYMVDYTFTQTVSQKGCKVEDLSAIDRQTILEQVYQFWAVPSPNLATPPPHSTGAAIDITLVDATGNPVNMGSPIDELSVRSYPDYFAQPSAPELAETLPGDQDLSEGDRQMIHQNRQQLKQVMLAAGFCQHPKEWWHFSFGDQFWAWQLNQDNPGKRQVARYGRVTEWDEDD
ncbi:M15 family metallopeptidase [Egbenema bharatensis]|uniref:M15 family metallopeptidase n=1 Tax=Egbenema bharatensis TaxID=3463334 RepID=UPI003A8C7BDA